MKKGQTNTVVIKHWTNTMWAAQNGHNELAEVLIEAGADINTTSIQKMTALNYVMRIN